MTAVLPSLNHFQQFERLHVYEPSDDTFLLCDALLKDRETFKPLKPSLVIEIGCGSGCVITYLTNLLLEDGIKIVSFAVDINPYAVQLTKKTSTINNVKL
jgi:release factor glutamine methyltransferase